jgi:hypothetical protein
MAPFWRENELVHTQKKEVKRSSWLGERRCKLGSKARWNSRIQFVSNASKLVSRNLDLRCCSCGPWYNFLGFLLFNLRWPLGVPSTYRRRLETPQCWNKILLTQDQPSPFKCPLSVLTKKFNFVWGSMTCSMTMQGLAIQRLWVMVSSISNTWTQAVL